MTIFGDIVSKLLRSARLDACIVSPEPAPETAAATVSTDAPFPAPTPLSGVDVAAVLDARVRESGRALDWRRSLTDLLAALDVDDGLAQHSRLAGELGCNGPIDDPATIERLHGKLMHALAANGGKVPPPFH
jgi:hypothetical protein